VAGARLCDAADHLVFRDHRPGPEGAKQESKATEPPAADLTSGEGTILIIEDEAPVPEINR